MRTPCPSRSGSRARRSIPHRNAASVLPDPVGAQIRAFSPAVIGGHPFAWAGVGASNDASNQRRTGSLNGASGLDSAVAEDMALNPRILRIGDPGLRVTVGRI